MNTGPKRRRYDEAFKRQAVRELVSSGKSVTDVAASLGVDRTNLQKWKKSFSHEVMNNSKISNEKPVGLSEFLSLKKEFESLKDTVVQLRAVIHKTLAGKYGNRW